MLMFEKMCMSSCAMSCWIDVMRSCQIVYWTFIWAYHTLFGVLQVNGIQIGLSWQSMAISRCLTRICPHRTHHHHDSQWARYGLETTWQARVRPSEGCVVLRSFALAAAVKLRQAVAVLEEAVAVQVETAVLASTGPWHPQLVGHALHGSWCRTICPIVPLNGP